MKKAAIFLLALALCLAFSSGALADDYGYLEVELAGNATYIFEAATAEYADFPFFFVGEDRIYVQDALFITVQPGSIMEVIDRYSGEGTVHYGYFYEYYEDMSAYALSDMSNIEMFSECVDLYFLGWGMENAVIDIGEEEAIGGKRVYLKYGEGGAVSEDIVPEGTYFATGGHADFIFEDAQISNITIPIGTEYFGEYEITMQDAVLISVNPDSMIYVVEPGSTEPSFYYGYYYSQNSAGTAYELMASIEFTSTLAWVYFEGMGDEGTYIYNLGTGIDFKPIYLICEGWEILTESKPVSPQTPAVPSNGAEEIVLTIGSKTAVVDGSAKEIDVVPEVINGTTFVPVRFITENLGMTVNWINGKVQLLAEGKEIVLTPDSPEVSFNGESKTLLAAPFVKENRTMVPLRFIGEASGYTVNYDAATKVITIK